jgi:cell division protein FtsA
MDEDQIITALDLGSSKTVALVARLLPPEEIELIGMGVAESRGIKNGAVTNIEQTIKSIREATEEAELMSGVEIEEILLNITGKHIKGDNSTGVVAITNKDRVVTAQDIYRVVDAAQAVRIPADEEILHVLSREFKVDDQTGIKDPMGMMGVRLEADVHIVTGSSTHLQNTEKAIYQSGIHVRDKVLSSLASSQALLTDSEKELGVAVVDIGAGTIDIIMYIHGGVAYTSSIALGGQHITQDISIGLKTPFEAAEMLKKRSGSVDIPSLNDAEMVEIPSVGDRAPRMSPRIELATIMEARMREMLELIDRELLRSGYKNYLAGGVIFTGGASLVEGLITLAEEVLQLGTSIGTPRPISGLSEKIQSPVFATGAGLLQYFIKYGEVHYKDNAKRNFFRKMKLWFQQNL